MTDPFAYAQNVAPRLLKSLAPVPKPVSVPTLPVPAPPSVSSALSSVPTTSLSSVPTCSSPSLSISGCLDGILKYLLNLLTVKLNWQFFVLIIVLTVFVLIMPSSLKFLYDKCMFFCASNCCSTTANDNNREDYKNIKNDLVS